VQSTRQFGAPLDSPITPAGLFYAPNIIIDIVKKSSEIRHTRATLLVRVVALFHYLKKRVIFL